MAIYDDDRERLQEEEQPGPPDLESVLFGEMLKDAVEKPPLIVEPSATLHDVLQIMRDNRRGVVLVAAEGKLAGIFTERDVLMKIAGTRVDLKVTPVRNFMTPDPDALPAESSIAFAINKMVGEGYRHIPLVDDKGRPTGVVSMRDLIEHIAGFYLKDVLNLPPNPRATSRQREGA
jgi:2-oxoglutarate/2-oxoacid ferredoxin oxidoreductase subunit beta